MQRVYRSASQRSGANVFSFHDSYYRQRHKITPCQLVRSFVIDQTLLASFIVFFSRDVLGEVIEQIPFIFCLVATRPMGRTITLNFQIQFDFSFVSNSSRQNKHASVFSWGTPKLRVHNQQSSFNTNSNQKTVAEDDAVDPCQPSPG